MFCTNCGKKINENDNFCKYCGKMRTKNIVHFEDEQKVKKENVKPSLENIYLNASKDGFSKDKINVFAFLFGPYYLLYRKMYLYGILWLFLNLFVLIFTSGLISFLFYTVLAVYFALEFNFLYQKKMEDDLNQIKKIDQDKQISICRLKGGTTVVSVIVAVIVSFILFSLVNDYKSYENRNNDYYGYEEYYR